MRIKRTRGIGVISGILCLAVVGVGGAEDRAVELARACLESVRNQHLRIEQKREKTPDEVTLDRLFQKTVTLEPECIRQYLEGGGNDCDEVLRQFIEIAKMLSAEKPGEDAGSIMVNLLLEQPEVDIRDEALFRKGYAAAFLLNMEELRDAGIMQDLLQFLVVMECPLTFHDLGIQDWNRKKLENLATTAASKAGVRFYKTTPYQFHLTLVRLNTWGSRYSGQGSGDKVAAAWWASDKVLREKMGRLPVRLKNATIACFGDSQTDRIHWSSATHYPEILKDLFRQRGWNTRVINAGKGGDDSGEGLERVEEDVLRHSPDICLIMFGGNDAAHWGGEKPVVPPEKYAKNISAIIGKLQKQGCRPVLLNTVSGLEQTEPERQVFRRILKWNERLADEKSVLHADVGGKIDVPEMSKRQQYYAMDRVHLNDGGQRQVVLAVLDVLADL